MGYSRDQKREYQRVWVANRRLKALEYLGGKCVECETDENLEFDHVDRSTKEKNIQALLSGKWEKLKTELDKCQLLCHDCHIAKTVDIDTPQWQGELYKHGTHGMYHRHACRCKPCTEAHASLAREYRASGKKW